jgi:transposase
MGYTSRFFAEPEVWMPWKESSVMEERLRFVARLLDGEPMTDVCREFGISRKTGYKIFNRYREHGCEAFGDRSRRPVRYANQLPQQVESLIVTLKREKPHWGARKIRELLLRRLASDVRVPAKSTIHAVLDRHGLVKRTRMGGDERSPLVPRAEAILLRPRQGAPGLLSIHLVQPRGGAALAAALTPDRPRRGSPSVPGVGPTAGLSAGGWAIQRCGLGAGDSAFLRSSIPWPRCAGTPWRSSAGRLAHPRS